VCSGSKDSGPRCMDRIGDSELGVQDAGYRIWGL
jgi:hypothetical protein